MAAPGCLAYAIAAIVSESEVPTGEVPTCYTNTTRYSQATK